MKKVRFQYSKTNTVEVKVSISMPYYARALSTFHADKVVCPASLKGPEIAQRFVTRNTRPPNAHDRDHDDCMKLILTGDPSENLTRLIGRDVYPVSFVSGNGVSLELTPSMCLIAPIDGITLDATILMVDDYYKLKVFEDTQVQSEAKLLASMAVWKAKRGIYYLKNLNRSFTLEFDEVRWAAMKQKFIEWSNTF
jgi:hypothetical protein